MIVGLVMVMGVASPACTGVYCNQGCSGTGCASECGDPSDLNASYGCGSQCDTGFTGGDIIPDDLVGCAEDCTAHYCGEMCSGTTCAAQSIGDYSSQQCDGYMCKF